MVPFERILAWRRCRRRYLAGERDSAVVVYARREQARMDAIAREHARTELTVSADTPETAVGETLCAVNNGRSVSGATLALDGVYLAVEVLRYSSRREGWEAFLYRAATGVRGVYFDEAAFVLAAAEDAGIPITSITVRYLDKTYVRGEEIELSSLVRESNVTKRAARLTGSIRELCRDFCSFTDSGLPIPDDYRCERSCSLCVPRPELDRTSVLTLHRGSALGQELLERGIKDLLSIPAEIKLTTRQRVQIEAVRGDTVHVDCDLLCRFLDHLVEPVSFLDFEAFAQATPPFPGTRPFEHVPSVASVHVRRGRAVQTMTIAFADAADRRAQMFRWLCAALPERGSVVVFNSAFESAMIRQIGAAAGEQAAAEGIVERLVDLLDPFVQFAVYHPDQRGKTSLKRVLPALTGRGYAHLEVNDGMEANLSYLHQVDRVRSGRGSLDSRLASAAVDADGQARPFEPIANIVAYCNVDTGAMIDVVDALLYLRDSRCP